jgi:oligosaccharide repeat unit polymerase
MFRNSNSRTLGPRWVLPAYWVLFLSATMLLHPGSALTGKSVLIIISLCLMFSYGATLATLMLWSKDHSHLRKMTLQTPELSGQKLRWMTFAGATSNLCAALLALRNSQFSLSDLISLEDLALSTNTLTVERYSGQGEGVVVFILLGIGYVAALIAPFIGLTGSKHRVLWALLPALTSLAYATVTSARLGFLLSAALTAGGFIACAVARNGSAPKIRLKSVVAVALMIVIVGGAFTAIGVLRTGRLDAVVIQATIDKQASYTVGTVGAFSTWYDGYGTGLEHDLGYGTATVAGMEFITGQDREATRAYSEFAVIDDAGRTSNVYTVFRGLLLDFGIAGSFAFLGVAGFIFGRLYLRATKGSIVSAALLGYCYASILFSGWMAMTTFTNVLVVAIAAPIALRIATKRPRHTARRPELISASLASPR